MNIKTLFKEWGVITAVAYLVVLSGFFLLGYNVNEVVGVLTAMPVGTFIGCLTLIALRDKIAVKHK